ncbi:hypothetical protein D7231_34240 [Streptomyces klenkii]|uniref:Uncharacterized protein n=1 Tax=Streptomyces klenkii TaxID=1420899 RepID=A0A3B0AGR2_9ACTN|nr:hypothetical protein D7231_34240 [Streptomyces klenkii]
MKRPDTRSLNQIDTGLLLRKAAPLDVAGTCQYRCRQTGCTRPRQLGATHVCIPQRGTLQRKGRAVGADVAQCIDSTLRQPDGTGSRPRHLQHDERALHQQRLTIGQVSMTVQPVNATASIAHRCQRCFPLLGGQVAGRIEHMLLSLREPSVRGVQDAFRCSGLDEIRSLAGTTDTSHQLGHTIQRRSTRIPQHCSP